MLLFLVSLYFYTYCINTFTDLYYAFALISIPDVRRFKKNFPAQQYSTVFFLPMHTKERYGTENIGKKTVGETFQKKSPAFDKHRKTLTSRMP